MTPAVYCRVSLYPENTRSLKLKTQKQAECKYPLRLKSLKVCLPAICIIEECWCWPLCPLLCALCLSCCDAAVLHCVESLLRTCSKVTVPCWLRCNSETVLLSFLTSAAHLLDALHEHLSHLLTILWVGIGRRWDRWSLHLNPSHQNYTSSPSEPM